MYGEELHTVGTALSCRVVDVDLEGGREGREGGGNRREGQRKGLPCHFSRYELPAVVVPNLREEPSWHPSTC